MSKNFEKVKRFVLSPIGILLGVLVSSALSGTVEAVESLPQFLVIEKLAGVVALLGMFVGIIYATHPGEASQLWDRPIVRTLLALGVSVTLVVAIYFSLFAAAILVASFGVLSWVGMKCVYQTPSSTPDN
jgi:hypothetical protein